MNVKQLLNKFDNSTKRIEVFTPNPIMNWDINLEHWIEKIEEEETDNQCLIYVEYWQQEGEQFNVEKLTHSLSQVTQTSEIKIIIPTGERLNIK